MSGIRIFGCSNLYRPFYGDESQSVEFAFAITDFFLTSGGVGEQIVNKFPFQLILFSLFLLTMPSYVGQERRSIPFIEFGTENNVHTNWQLNSVNPLTETASCPTNATSFGIVGNAPNISLPEEDPLTIEHARLFHQ